MIVRLAWPQCRLFEPDRPDAFWLECTRAEALGLTPHLQPDHQRDTTADTLYFLAARDGRLQAFEWFFPFSGMWNGESPFQPVASTHIASLKELRDLPLTPGETWLPKALSR